jgi:hypothetical protein
MKLLLTILLPTLLFAGTYRTYQNRTFWVQRETELGRYDTLRIDSITSVSRNGTTTTLRRGLDVVFYVTEPKEKIIGAQGE